MTNYRNVTKTCHLKTSLRIRESVNFIHHVHRIDVNKHVFFFLFFSLRHLIDIFSLRLISWLDIFRTQHSFVFSIMKLEADSRCRYSMKVGPEESYEFILGKKKETQWFDESVWINVMMECCEKFDLKFYTSTWHKDLTSWTTKNIVIFHSMITFSYYSFSHKRFDFSLDSYCFRLKYKSQIILFQWTYSLRRWQYGTSFISGLNHLYPCTDSSYTLEMKSRIGQEHWIRQLLSIRRTLFNTHTHRW